MRIIGHIDHPQLKITVFRMDQRVSVKFENAGYELTYKLGDDERLNNLAAVQQWVDAPLIERVQALLQQMHAARLAALARLFPSPSDEVFEDII